MTKVVWEREVNREINSKKLKKTKGNQPCQAKPSRRENAPVQCWDMEKEKKFRVKIGE